MNLTPRSGVDSDRQPNGLSLFRTPEGAAFAGGGKVQVIDSARLRTLIVVEDKSNPGHVTVRLESQVDLNAWAASRGSSDFMHQFTAEVLEAIVGEMRIRP